MESAGAPDPSPDASPEAGNGPDPSPSPSTALEAALEFEHNTNLPEAPPEVGGAGSSFFTRQNLMQAVLQKMEEQRQAAIAAATNFAVGFAPIVGPFNRVSALLGGPTAGSLLSHAITDRNFSPQAGAWGRDVAALSQGGGFQGIGGGPLSSAAPSAPGPSVGGSPPSDAMSGAESALPGLPPDVALLMVQHPELAPELWQLYASPSALSPAIPASYAVA